MGFWLKNNPVWIGNPWEYRLNKTFYELLTVDLGKDHVGFIMLYFQLLQMFGIFYILLKFEKRVGKQKIISWFINVNN